MSRDRVIQLQECAEELGFSTITEALDAGYHEVQDLVAGTFTLEKIDEQEKAHEAWLKERDDLCERLRMAVHRRRTLRDYNLANLMAEAHDFIKEQCHD